MDIKQLQKAVVTEIRDYIQAHAPIDYDGTGKTVLDAEPLVRMVEIHFSHLNAHVDVDKFVSESVEGIHKYIKHKMKKRSMK